MTPDESINILGGPLAVCGSDPVTGFFRDGSCNTCAADQGSHTVCAIMTAEFLAYSKYVGNDLVSLCGAFLASGGRGLRAKGAS